MFEDSILKGASVPYCVIWVGSRSGKPLKIGDSISGTGIFKKNDPIEKSLTTVSVTQERNKPNSAQINFIDTSGLLDQGLHAGVEVYIKLGYTSTGQGISGLGKPQAKLVMAGIAQRPSVNFQTDGTIQMGLKVNDKTDMLRYEKRTRSFKNISRAELVSSILDPHIGKALLSKTITIKTGATKEERIDQTRLTDLEFLYYLARKWGCTFDTRINETSLGIDAFFVDDDTAGDALLNSMDASLKGEGNVYIMEWRDGLRNVSEFTFSGDASGGGAPGGIIERGTSGEMEEVDRPLEVSADENDPSNWELDQKKVDKWLRANPDKSFDDFKLLAFSLPQNERHRMFYERKPTSMAGTPASKVDASDPGLGIGGYTASFNLVKGDPFLCPNTPVRVGGDVYGMFKSRSTSPNSKSESSSKDVREKYRKDILYWRVTEVTHQFGPGGFITSGKMIR